MSDVETGITILRRDHPELSAVNIAETIFFGSVNTCSTASESTILGNMRPVELALLFRFSFLSKWLWLALLEHQSNSGRLSVFLLHGHRSSIIASRGKYT
jgi:hypothetical protein